MQIGSPCQGPCLRLLSCLCGDSDLGFTLSSRSLEVERPLELALRWSQTWARCEQERRSWLLPPPLPCPPWCPVLSLKVNKGWCQSASGSWEAVPGLADPHLHPHPTPITPLGLATLLSEWLGDFSRASASEFRVVLPVMDLLFPSFPWDPCSPSMFLA